MQIKDTVSRAITLDAPLGLTLNVTQPGARVYVSNATDAGIQKATLPGDREGSEKFIEAYRAAVIFAGTVTR